MQRVSDRRFRQSVAISARIQSGALSECRDCQSLQHRGGNGLRLPHNCGQMTPRNCAFPETRGFRSVAGFGMAHRFPG